MQIFETKMQLWRDSVATAGATQDRFAAADVQEVGRSGSLPLTSPPKEG